MTEVEPTPLLEDLVVRSAGYLKVPKAFREKFPHWDDKPTPTASLTTSEGKVSLIYTWTPESLE